MRRNGRFTAALRRAMKKAGMSSGDVARELNVGRTTVYDWLAGSEPSDQSFAKLVRLFPELREFAR